MNGAHDLGGMHGFGPIDPEPNEPVFHSGWERRAFAITVACGFGGDWNIDMARYSRENLEPKVYLAATYYERWVLGLQALLIENGHVTEEEIRRRMAELAATGAG